MKPIWLKKGFFINLCILLVIFGLGFGLHWLSQQTVVASWLEQHWPCLLYTS